MEQFMHVAMVGRLVAPFAGGVLSGSFIAVSAPVAFVACVGIVGTVGIVGYVFYKALK